MKTLIVYVSIEHGNTEKVARAMAEVLGADTKKASEVDPNSLSPITISSVSAQAFSKVNSILRCSS
jgi:flavodoxin